MKIKLDNIPVKYKNLFIFFFILLSLLLNLSEEVFLFADEEEVITLYDLGKRKLQKREFNKAIEYLKKAVEENPDFEEAWYELGNAYYSKGDLKSAVKSYYISMGVNQDFKKPLKKIGKCYLEQKRYNLAIKKFKKAGENFPGDPSISYLTGQTYEKTGDWNNAISAYIRAERLDKEKYGFLKEKIEKLKEKIGSHSISTGPPPPAPTPEELPDTITPAIPTDQKKPGETSILTPLPTSTAIAEEPTSPEIKPSDSIEGKGEIKSRFLLKDEGEESKGQGSQNPADRLKTFLIIVFITIIILGLIYLIMKAKSKKQSVGKMKPRRFLEQTHIPDGFTEDDEIFLDDDEEDVEEFDSPSRFFYRDVITGEREKRKVKHEDTILKIREKLKKEEEEALLSISDNQAKKEASPEMKVEREGIRKPVFKITGTLIGKESTDPSEYEIKTHKEETEKTKTTVEIPVSKTPVQKKYPKKSEEEPASEEKGGITPAPFVCSCGKIIRDGSPVCPRCGRGTR